MEPYQKAEEPDLWRSFRKIECKKHIWKCKIKLPKSQSSVF